MRANKLEDGARIFKGILHALLVNAVSVASEVDEAKKLITSACEYSLAMAIELSRRNLGTPEEVAASPAAPQTPVIDIMEALKKSLAASEARKPGPKSVPAPAQRRQRRKAG